MNRLVKVFTCCCFSIIAHSQEGRIIRFTSAYAMFPDSSRAQGHNYNGKHYDAATHYSDSSVLLYVPKHFSPKEKLNLVFWFHGWGNSIDSACKQYQLLQQFEASGRNAVFVFPEGPKNAPDSYGGKLEQPVVFRQLTKQVVEQLTANKLVPKQENFDITRYDITLAGHSGAYRVISRVINRSPVNEVILFDAMYGGNDAYLEWLSDPAHRFINIYTKDGGTYDNSLFILQSVKDSLHIPVSGIAEADVSEQTLRSHNKLFIFSEQSHNAVITYQRNWERFLRSGKK
jgi:predicted esterase